MYKPKENKFLLSNMQVSFGGKSDIDIKSPLQKLSYQLAIAVIKNQAAPLGGT